MNSPTRGHTHSSPNPPTHTQTKQLQNCYRYRTSTTSSQRNSPSKPPKSRLCPTCHSLYTRYIHSPLQDSNLSVLLPNVAILTFRTNSRAYSSKAVKPALTSTKDFLRLIGFVEQMEEEEEDVDRSENWSPEQDIRDGYEVIDHFPKKKEKKRDKRKNGSVGYHVHSDKELLKEEEEIDMTKNLSSDQQKVLELVLEGKNVFITGSAGTGKSYLIARIKKELERKGNVVAVTASTGIAAVNIGGSTLHRWAGIGIGNDMVKQLKAASSKKNVKNWTKTDVLIIDEISLIGGELFDMLEELARQIRGNDEPFGGLQLILSGDFFQLPPVRSPLFCFEANSWKRCVYASVPMRSIFRQNEPEFITMLNEIRFGKCSQKTIQLLEMCRNQERNYDDGILPTVLYSRNVDVDNLNNQKLSELPGEMKLFRAIDRAFPATPEVMDLLEDCMAPPKLELKKDAQVMLVKNLSDSLCNGSRGVIVGFEENFPFLPIVRFANGQVVTVERADFNIFTKWGRASRKQIPLKLAYAVTIHKSQGLTLDRAKISLESVFEYGQAYVALSRLRGLKGVELEDWAPKTIKAHPKVLKFYRSLPQSTTPEQVIIPPKPVSSVRAVGSEGNGDYDDYINQEFPLKRTANITTNSEKTTETILEVKNEEGQMVENERTNNTTMVSIQQQEGMNDEGIEQLRWEEQEEEYINATTTTPKKQQATQQHHSRTKNSHHHNQTQQPQQSSHHTTKPPHTHTHTHSNTKTTKSTATQSHPTSSATTNTIATKKAKSPTTENNQTKSTSKNSTFKKSTPISNTTSTPLPLSTQTLDPDDLYTSLPIASTFPFSSSDSYDNTTLTYQSDNNMKNTNNNNTHHNYNNNNKYRNNNSSYTGAFQQSRRVYAAAYELSSSSTTSTNTKRRTTNHHTSNNNNNNNNNNTTTPKMKAVDETDAQTQKFIQDFFTEN